MKRVLLLVPENVTFDTLTPEQQTAIQGIFGQWVMPMPSTIPFEGYQICDAVCSPSFDPTLMPSYGFDWPIIGQWLRDGDEMTVITPLDEQAISDRSPDYTGELPHNWAGWPDVT